jgi:hypothetical protein
MRLDHRDDAAPPQGAVQCTFNRFILRLTIPAQRGVIRDANGLIPFTIFSQEVSMRLRNSAILVSMAGVMAVGSFSLSLRAEDPKSTTNMRAPAPPLPDAPQGMDPKMMEEMIKAGTPGPQHALLKKYTGTFSANCTMSMMPGAPEMTSKGELKTEMILGGRVQSSTYSGDMMGQPFKGMCFVGYDNMKQKWFTIWMDDMSTGMMSVEGDGDAAGKVVTFKGEMPCPANGGKITPFRQVVTFKDDDHYTVEMFSQDAAGKEFRGMSIEYTRVK